jgi:hypothetical protein
MNTRVNKTQKNKNQSVSNGASQTQRSGESTVVFVDNRPEAVAQRKLQEMANNSPRAIQMKAFQEMANNSHQEKLAVQFQRKTTENVIQLVEAGAQPIKVEKGDEDNEFSISGLINCVGVVIMIYGEGDQAFDYVAVVGGHFVTPEMYQFGDGQGFTDAGQDFLANINTLIDGIDHVRLETTYYIKAPADEGANPQSLVQAMTAATAIKNSLGLSGQIEQVAGKISVSV